MALLSIKIEYIILIFVVKEATWIRLLLTKIDLLDKKDHFAKIKVLKDSKRME